MNTELAFNASTMYKDIPNAIKPTGLQIIEGVVVQDTTSKVYTLGIKDNNELKAYKPRVTAKEVLADGTNTALSGFVPLIENHQPVDKIVFKAGPNILVKHPRQVIAQFDNLDILFLSCGGRGYDGDGMDADDLTRVLMDLKVKFALNLDGGGSVTTVVGDHLITKKIDKNGTLERLRPNFLYVLKN